MTEIAPGIVVDPKIRFGKPVIKGTRVPVDLVVAQIAGGMSTEKVCEEYGLAREDVLAALSYAARFLAEEQVRAVGGDLLIVEPGRFGFGGRCKRVRDAPEKNLERPARPET